MKIVEWQEYTELLQKLHREVMLRNYDGIVAIGRGGCIIGAYLASKMGIPTFYPVFIRHVGRGKEMKIVAHDLGQVRNLTGRLLVVDDWLCEGRAMRYVLDLIPKSATCTTLVMFNRKGSEFKPDIVGAYVDENERDILFPYDPI
ncbi:MAG: phosphoribosyltransferase [Candidatus Bathyarchaeia archaeon]